MIEIVLGLIIVLLMYVLIKNDYCYKLSCRISKNKFYYTVATGELDFNYEMDCYLGSSCWLNPFGYWTERSMCYNKDDYDKLKKWIDEHPQEIDKIKRHIKETYGSDI